MSEILAYAAAGAVFLSGTAHAIATGSMVAGFGDISADNRRVITKQWVAESLAKWFVAALVIAVTAAGGMNEAAADLVYRFCAGFLILLGAWTASIGWRTAVIEYKACPVVMSVAAGLLVAASLV
jgi:hypothetical protein